MTFPDLSSAGEMEPPRWGGVRELNLGDAWRARWSTEESLPAGARIDRLYATVLLDNKGYVCRSAGEENWNTIEGRPPEGEKPEGYLRKAARDQIGADAARIDLVGYLECVATRHNTEFPAGTRAIRPFYALVAKKVASSPRDASFERRRLPLNEFMRALRLRYPEFEEYLGRAVERYVVLHARGEAG